jgi:hypothetical protein
VKRKNESDHTVSSEAPPVEDTPGLVRKGEHARRRTALAIRTAHISDEELDPTMAASGFTGFSSPLPPPISTPLSYSRARGDVSCLSCRYMPSISSLYRAFKATRLSFIVGVRIPFSGVQGFLSRVTEAHESGSTQ